MNAQPDFDVNFFPSVLVTAYSFAVFSDIFVSNFAATLLAGLYGFVYGYILWRKI
jgi:hypothetical protein